MIRSDTLRLKRIGYCSRRIMSEVELGRFN